MSLKTKPRGKAWDAFSLYIRLRDAQPHTGYVVCCTCGFSYHYKQMDAGHFIPWAAGNATKYHERNVHGQCKRCNNWGQGEQLKYKYFIDQKYGKGESERLLVLSKTTKKYFPFELDELTKFWRKEAEKIKLEKKI